jgi:hypothetical protein
MLAVAALLLLTSAASALTAREALRLREQAREMHHHGMEAWWRGAQLHDEVLPLSCTPRPHEHLRGTLDDALGNFSLTLVDAMDTYALMGAESEFRNAVRTVISHVSFDQNVSVSVFETTIRTLGGLLSAHLLITAPGSRYCLPVPDPEESVGSERRERGERASPCYRGELLRMARDLGGRLLPAFRTATGIPSSTVHLRTGRRGGGVKTCSAAAGTLLLEFALLSRLTGDASFERAARGAVRAIWRRRSAIDLVGNEIDINTGAWYGTTAGIGAGIDSFYEYLNKGAILVNEREWDGMWFHAKAAVRERVAQAGSGWWINVDRTSGRPLGLPIVTSLAAFWPGVLSMGDTEDVLRARQSHANFMAVWKQFRGLPEAWLLRNNAPPSPMNDAGYPLRPELIESSYLLWERTHDDAYVHDAAAIMGDIQTRARTACGFAALADVATDRLDDRMDSYFLAETTKYLFLLFDAAFVRAVRREGSRGRGGIGRRRGDNGAGRNASDATLETRALRASCSAAVDAAVYTAWKSPSASRRRSAAERRQRHNWEARRRVDLKERCLTHRPLRMPALDVLFTTEGHPILLTHPDVVRAFNASVEARAVPSDAASTCAREPPRARLENLLRRPRAKLDPPSVAPRSAAPSFVAPAGARPGQAIALVCDAAGDCTPTIAEEASGVRIQVALGAMRHEMEAVAAAFGAPMNRTARGTLIAATPLNGCSGPLANKADVRGRVVLVKRGTCSFAVKAHAAQDAGAIGMIVISDGEAFTMAGGGEDGEAASDEPNVRIPLAMVAKASGDRLIELLRVSKRGTPRKDVLIELPTRAVADEIAQAAKAREQMQQALEAQPQVHAHILAMIQKMSEGGDGFSGGQFVVTLGSAVSP